jgi:mersacidin/lichenicidin family type 2 lantibiotic
MNSNIVRAWKDESYRQSLSDEERAQLPENPVGELELTDAELESVFAGQGNERIQTYEPCENTFGGGCYTHTFARECVRPHYTFDFDSCYSYRYNLCHHFTRSYSRECYPYQEKR